VTWALWPPPKSRDHARIGTACGAADLSWPSRARIPQLASACKFKANLEGEGAFWL